MASEMKNRTKKPYTAPQLQVYGGLKDLTRHSPNAGLTPDNAIPSMGATPVRTH